jgi:chitinase
LSQLSDEFADCKISVDGVTGCLGSFLVQKQKNPHLKVVLSVGGGNAGANFAVAASYAASRDLFAKSAATLVTNGHLDGIDRKFCLLYP